MSELGRAREYFTKAFELRERTSERERLFITADYYQFVTGELDKVAQVYQEMLDSYPRNADVYLALSVVSAQQGQYEKATGLVRQALLLTPDQIGGYEDLVNYELALQSFR